MVLDRDVIAARFLLTSASCSSSAIAELLVYFRVWWLTKL